MAKSGRKFVAKAKIFVGTFCSEKEILDRVRWPTTAITADWTVTFEREPRVYFIQKGEHSGEYYETKPFYSSVLTEEEVTEIEADVPDIRERLTKFIEVIEE